MLVMIYGSYFTEHKRRRGYESHFLVYKGGDISQRAWLWWVEGRRVFSMIDS